MRYSLLALLIAVFALCSDIKPVHAENRVYSVGIVPQFEVRRMHQIWRPILDQVEDKTGVRFIIKGGVNHTCV